MLIPNILFEDPDILVIDKPAGLIVNRADTTVNQPTVQEWAEEKLKTQNSKLKTEGESDFHRRGGVVHRLYKETSGGLIIAKNKENFFNIQKQFKGGGG